MPLNPMSVATAMMPKAAFPSMARSPSREDRLQNAGMPR